MLPIERMVALSGGKTRLEGPDLVKALRLVASKESPDKLPLIFCLRNPGQERPVRSTDKTTLTPLKESDMSKDFDARFQKLEHDVARFGEQTRQTVLAYRESARVPAKLELEARMEERANLEADLILAQDRNDRAAVQALKPRLAEFAALEARAFAPEPAAEFTAQDAEDAADEILREHGLIAPQSHTPLKGGVMSLHEPDLGDPRSRYVAVAVGDAGKVIPSGFSQADADAEAERLLLEAGFTPKPSAAP